MGGNPPALEVSIRALLRVWTVPLVHSCAPLTRLGPPEQPHRRVPRAVGPLLQPAPAGGMRQHQPDRQPQRTRQVGRVRRKGGWKQLNRRSSTTVCPTTRFQGVCPAVGQSGAPTRGSRVSLVGCGSCGPGGTAWRWPDLRQICPHGYRIDTKMYAKNAILVNEILRLADNRFEQAASFGGGSMSSVSFPVSVQGFIGPDPVTVTANGATSSPTSSPSQVSSQPGDVVYTPSPVTGGLSGASPDGPKNTSMKETPSVIVFLSKAATGGAAPVTTTQPVAATTATVPSSAASTVPAPTSAALTVPTPVTVNATSTSTPTTDSTAGAANTASSTASTGTATATAVPASTASTGAASTSSPAATTGATSGTSSTAAASPTSSKSGSSSGSSSSGSGGGGSSAAAAAAAEEMVGSFTTTVAGVHYSASIMESGGTYTASAPNIPGASASGASESAAENALTLRIDEMA